MSYEIKSLRNNIKKPSFSGGLKMFWGVDRHLSIYDIPDEPFVDDMEAIKHDWMVVGEDIYEAVNKFEERVKSDGSYK